MDSMPLEILLQVFKHFDGYTVLTRFRPVCKSFAYTAAIMVPSLKISGLPPALWEKVFSHMTSRSGVNDVYSDLNQVSRTCSSFQTLLRDTKLPSLQIATFQSSAESVSAVDKAHSPAKTPILSVNVSEHPAFSSICCRIELGGLIYHRTGNSCPPDLLAFPVAEENATHPPLQKALVTFESKYGVKLRPVLISKEGDQADDGKGRSTITVGDVYHAMKRLFVEPLTEKQAKALKEMREWEMKKHEAVRNAVSKLERQALTNGSSATEADDVSNATNTTSDDASLADDEEPAAEKPPELPKEPVIEHDESIIRFEESTTDQPNPHGKLAARSKTTTASSNDKILRQREFLKDFPYVYASVHARSFVNGIQEFVLSYH